MNRLPAAANIYTIGHSTRSIDEFVALLRQHGIERLIDVRSVPRSRHNPQFDRKTLAQSLRNRRIAYRHMKSLGGRRRPRRDSVNTGWRNDGFRGYADYMQTPEFDAAVDRLLALVGGHRVALMCAEAVPWRCHRSLLSDALTVRGVAVMEIIGPASCRLHKLTPFARVHGRRITYPPPAEPQAA